MRVQWDECVVINSVHTIQGCTYFIIIVWKFTDPFISSVNNAEYWNFNLGIVSIPCCYTRLTCCLCMFLSYLLNYMKCKNHFRKFCHIQYFSEWKYPIPNCESRIWRILNVLFDISVHRNAWWSETNGYITNKNSHCSFPPTMIYIWV